MKNYFFIIMLLLGGGFACAQTTTVSKETEIPLVVGEKTIVRSCDNDVIVTYVKRNNFNTFDVRSRTNLTNRHFRLNFEYNQLGSPLYDVNDMYIYKRWCYFCGTKCIPTETLHSLDGSIVTFYDTVGFVGRFNIDSVWNGTGHYYLQQIDEAKTLNQLTVYNTRELTIDAIGSYRENTDSSCVVELFYSNQSGNWRWEYQVFLLDDPREILTDIIATDNMLVTASYSDTSQYKLIIRQTKLGGIRFVTYPDFRFIYSSETDTLKAYRIPFCRFLLSPMEGDGFEVAYEAADSNGKRYVILYKMNTPSYMQKAQYLTTSIGNRLTDMTYVHQMDGTVLLCHDLQHPNGLLRFPHWPTPLLPYGETALYSNSVLFHSIDADNNHYYLASGNTHSSRKLHQFFQNRNSTNGCLNGIIYHLCYRPLEEITPDNVNCVWFRENHENCNWTKDICNTEFVIGETICNFNLPLIINE